MTDLVTELMQFMDTFPVVDAHEHLPAEESRLKQDVDFSTLFSHYCIGDLISAGISAEHQNRFYSPKTDPAEKWQIFQPYYDRIHDGSYARSARIAMKKFYGFDDLRSEADALAVTERVREANAAGLYQRVLKDACNLRVSLVFGGHEVDERHFRAVEYLSGPCDVRTMNDVESMAQFMGYDGIPPTLDRYVDILGEFLATRKEDGLAGVKFAYAYQRDLEFPGVTTHDAERVYDRIFEESQGWRDVVLGFGEARPLQNYLVHRVVEFCGELDLPVVFHTGIQAGNENRPDNCRPERLWSLINRYRGTTFVLLHGGIPWVNEAALLSKYFANVYLDMTWMHIISPEISRRALSAWVDLLPKNKINGFGGDYSVVEKVYGHLVMAKENIAHTLASFVENGAMTTDEAMQWAKAILHDNPARIYHLDKLGI